MCEVEQMLFSLGFFDLGWIMPPFIFKIPLKVNISGVAFNNPGVKDCLWGVKVGPVSETLVFDKM